MKKMTMKDIGQLAGVSQSTVSRVLSGKGYIKEEVKERVLSIVDQYNFYPNLNACIMRGDKTKILGFISTCFENQYYFEMVKFIEEEARKYGYTIIVMNSEKDEKIEKAHILELLKRKVDGFIIAPVNIKNLKLIKNNNIPLVVLNEKIDWIDSFYTSLFTAGEQVANFFSEDKNINKVGYIGEMYSDKLEGFKSKINDKRILNNENLNIYFTLEKGFKNKLSEKVKNIDMTCDAFFMSSDEVALCIINECRKNNMDILSKKIVSFDNTIISEALQISSIKQPMKRMIFLAMEVLTKKINNEIPLEKIFNMKLEPKLIVRK